MDMPTTCTVTMGTHDVRHADTDTVHLERRAEGYAHHCATPHHCVSLPSFGMQRATERAAHPGVEMSGADKQQDLFAEMSSDPLWDMSPRPSGAMSSNALGAMSSNPLGAMLAHPCAAMSSNALGAMSSNALGEMSSDPCAAMSFDRPIEMAADPYSPVERSPHFCADLQSSSGADMSRFQASEKSPSHAQGPSQCAQSRIPLIKEQAESPRTSPMKRASPMKRTKPGGDVDALAEKPAPKSRRVVKEEIVEESKNDENIAPKRKRKPRPRKPAREEAGNDAAGSDPTVASTVDAPTCMTKPHTRRGRTEDGQSTPTRMVEPQASIGACGSDPAVASTVDGGRSRPKRIRKPPSRQGSADTLPAVGAHEESNTPKRLRKTQPLSGNTENVPVGPSNSDPTVTAAADGAPCAPKRVRKPAARRARATGAQNGPRGGDPALTAPAGGETNVSGGTPSANAPILAGEKSPMKARKPRPNHRAVKIEPNTTTKDAEPTEKSADTPERKSKAVLHPCCVPGCKNMGKHTRLADDLGPAGYRCRAHGSGHICSMPHCWFLGSIMIMPASGDKPAQFFCDTHGKVCVVEGCRRVGKRRVTQVDHYGMAGFRCLHHGGGRICSAIGCGALAVQKKREADNMGPEGYRCLMHTGSLCNVEGCNKPAVTNYKLDDGRAPPGQRCQQHGKICVVPGCPRSGKRKRDADSLGPEGYRCLAHGGGYACTVPGCATVAKVLFRQPDAKGPAGFRCNLHGRQCCIPGCVRVGRRRRPADDMGGEGFRCGYHGGGHECSVPGCANVATIIKPRDHLGPEGYRCTTHGNLCNVPGCNLAGRRRYPADKLGAAGRRCKMHSGSIPS